MSQQSLPRQTSGLKRYLSLAPVLAVLGLSLAFSLWMIINWFYPDRLSFGIFG